MRTHSRRPRRIALLALLISLAVLAVGSMSAVGSTSTAAASRPLAAAAPRPSAFRADGVDRPILPAPATLGEPAPATLGEPAPATLGEPAPAAWPYDSEPGWRGWPSRVSSPRQAWAVAAAVAPVAPTAAPTTPRAADAGPRQPAAATTTAKPTKLSSAAAPTAPSTPRYAGRNHLWIPTLGIDRSISFFSCDSSAYPGDRVYRWGCAGTDNVYLFGHAHSVFKPLHDAYVSGRLRKGMLVVYADGNGKVRTYAVSYWKVVSPVGSDWAYAAQASPSMTLQTCVGADSEQRLIVRLALKG